VVGEREGRYRYPLPRLAQARAKVGSRKTKSRSVGREPGERRFFASWEPGPGTVNENQTRESGSGGLGWPNLAHIKHALRYPCALGVVRTCLAFSRLPRGARPSRDQCGTGCIVVSDDVLTRRLGREGLGGVVD
jgi:hypothetical protein